MTDALQSLINLDDFEREAVARLGVGARDYYQGAAQDEITLRLNREAWQRWGVHYRVLRDVTQPDFATSILGTQIDWPVMLAPTACQCMAHEQGELATARAAAASGTAMVLSTLSNKSIEQVAPEAGRGLWFQLYVFRDRGITRELIARADAAGCRALAVTVDAPVGGLRERDLRNGFSYPASMPNGNFSVGRSTGDFMSYVNTLFDASLTWNDLDWICAQTRLPVLVKGVVRADDAQLAVQHGARGIIVSNHGGRQLDTSPATADVLEAVALAVAGRAAVLMDGGIRRGTDVLKALALGAQAVCVGRPALWGLAVAGEAGVARMLALLRREFEVAAALAGCRVRSDITRDLLHPLERVGAY